MTYFFWLKMSTFSKVCITSKNLISTNFKKFEFVIYIKVLNFFLTILSQYSQHTKKLFYWTSPGWKSVSHKCALILCYTKKFSTKNKVQIFSSVYDFLGFQKKCKFLMVFAISMSELLKLFLKVAIRELLKLYVVTVQPNLRLVER